MAEVVEQQDSKKDSIDIRNKAIKSYEEAYRSALELRNSFSKKSGYVREKQPDEKAFHKAKESFGEFRPFNRDVMEKNTNNGQGADVVLPNGQKIHLENQAQLYDKIVAFNKERGEFYDESHISATNKSDYQRLVTVNTDLDKAREDVLGSFEKRAYAFKRLSAVEDSLRSEMFKTPKPDELKNSKAKVSESIENKPLVESAVSERKTEIANPAPDPAPAPNPTGIKLDIEDGTRVAIADLVYQDSIPIDWAKTQNETAISHMRHTIALSFLQEDRFSVERDHFYNEIHKRSGKQIETSEEAANYLSTVLDSKESASILRDAAPGALTATNEYINNVDIDRSLQNAGYPTNRVTPGFRDDMMVVQAFSSRIGGEEGERSFFATLKDQKDNYLKALGDPKVGLAISGTMLGIGIVAGSGPAALAFGGAKLAIQFTNHLLDTEKGREFQKAVYGTATKFLESVGVKPEVIQGVTDSIKDLWEKTTGNRWAKLAMMGAAAAAFVTFGPSASELHAVAAPGVADIANQLPDASTSIESVATVDTFEPGSHSGESIQTGPSTEPSVDLPPVVDLYQIKSGDTLWDIAKDSYMSQHAGQTPNDIQLINMVNEIASHNNIDNPNLISSGATLEIPQGSTPSPEVVSGPTEWLKESGPAVSNRLDGMSDRLKDWKPEGHDAEPAPLPRGSMRV